MNDTVDLIFWCVVAAYVVHILDETLMNGGFVALVREHWWPEYNARMFFWFNTGFMAVIIVSVLLYENLGHHWVIAPLVWVFERATHGVTLHLWWTARYKEYSPGLLSSVLFLMPAYFANRYAIRPGLIVPSDALWGVGLGILGGLLITLGPTVLMPRLAARSGRSG